jgi:hypothetical protein
MSLNEFSTVYEGLRAQTREVIASIAPAWRWVNYGRMAWGADSGLADYTIDVDTPLMYGIAWLSSNLQFSPGRFKSF